MLEITAIVVILGILAAIAAAGVYAVRTIGDMKVTTVPQSAPTESYAALSDRVTALQERVKQLEGEASSWEGRSRSLMGTVGKLKQQIEKLGAVDNDAALDDLMGSESHEQDQHSSRWSGPTRQVRRR